jgi:hypothetical protein
VKFTNSPLLSQLLPAWRARFVAALILLAFGTLAARSAWLQVVRNDFLQQKGESRYSRVIELSATRGRIADRSGDMLAVSTPVKSVWAIPEDARLTPAQARELAGLLELDVRELNRRLASEKDFVFIRRQIPPDAAEKIAALNLPGIHQQREYRRYYPAGEVTAHMLGFTGVEDRGQEGIELAFEGQLAGKPGSRRVIKDRLGRIVEDVESIKPPQDGKDLTLALDAKVQYLAFTHLKQALAEHKAKAGGVVVLDARTGEVLALANLPAYNPNNRVKLSGAQLRNRALTDVFEPGSTLKPFTVALALEKGRFRFDSQIQTAPGRLTIGNATIHDAHPHGLLTLAQVIQKSSNVGAAKIAAAFSPEEMWRMFDDARLRPADQARFPGRGRRPPASLQNLAADRAGHHVLRPWHLGDADAAGPRLPGICPRRRSDPAVSDPAGFTASRGQIHFFFADGARGARHARDGRAARRHRAQGADSGLPRRRQDRHGAQAGGRPVRRPLRGGLRRLRAGVGSAPGGGGDDRRALRRQVLRRRSGGAGVRASDGRQPAHTRRGAGCAAEAGPGGAGCGGGAGESVKREPGEAQRVLDELQRQGVTAKGISARIRAR